MSKRGIIPKEKKITKRKEKIVKRSKIHSELFEEIEHLTTDITGKIFKI